MNISYSFGMIDLLHFGHINALKKASENADLRIFGVVSDAAADAWFGSHVSNESERREVIESIKYVDIVMTQETFDPIDNLRLIHVQYPDAVITLYHGNDWNVIPAKRYLETIGGAVTTFSYYDKLSPLKILDTLNRNETQDRRFGNLISTKANTLASLQGILKKSKIEPVRIITVREFRCRPKELTDEICSQFRNEKIVVRSSSKREDAFEESNAGHFASVLNVDTEDQEAVRRAVSEVINSYGSEPEEDEQILIQRQTEHVLMSGVVFTRDIQRNRPYYVINYDASGRTDSVTSGAVGTSAWMIHSITADSIPEKWKNLMEAVREIEDVFANMLLDIEFAITPLEVVIFQVRPLAAAYKFGRKAGEKEVYDARRGVIRQYKKLASHGLTCYSDMAFWNPAEMIGDNPKNLDYSLYRQIITKSAWNEGIVLLGYRKTDKELMYRFGNKPYINIEYSFEALTPAGISDTLAEKLKKYYMKKFKKDMSAHDKIEFEIVLNCFDFSMYKRLKELEQDGFSADEISQTAQALHLLTRKVISGYHNILKNDTADMKILESIRLDVQNITKGCKDCRLMAKSVHTLLDGISKYGTPQFSRQARCAFIAKSLCRSLAEEGYITPKNHDRFFSGIQTVAVEYDKDYCALLEGRMSKEEFCAVYGHLRAGTYNIRSPRYDQMEGLFVSGNRRGTAQDVGDICEDEQKEEIDSVIKNAAEKALRHVNMEGLSGEDILCFIKKATQEREYFKFVFTKSLSFAMELIKQMGTEAEIQPDDLSYLELPEIFAAEYYSDIERLKEFWKLMIEKRRELYKMNSGLILPPVICSCRDFDYIEALESRPNYITEKRISAEVVLLNENTRTDEITGRIAVIEKADPGYDWIFSKGIAGLVTKYGGAASHMAIRCAEFRIPAAIGCGAALYEYAAASRRITIDCRHECISRNTGKKAGKDVYENGDIYTAC